MNAYKLSANYLSFVTPFMHKNRRIALEKAIKSAMDGNTLSVTGLGRGLTSKTTEKHQIKRVDRLCSNNKLYDELPRIYQSIAHLHPANLVRPIIHIDWSHLDKRLENSVLRASLAAKGRSYTIYQEAHSRETSSVHRNFLETLKVILPKNSKPIIVTDGGFRNPWFRLVNELGWDYVGRVRGRTCYKQLDGEWEQLKDIEENVGYKAKELGQCLLSMKNPMSCRMVIFRKKAKGRKHMAASEKRARKNNYSRKSAKREKEPWLLATSLKNRDFKARGIAKIYATRMQIEEAFRDLKSGLDFNQCNSRKIERLNVILLIGMLAEHLLSLIGLAVIASKTHHSYQANSVKTKAVLSILFLGLRAVKNPRLKLRKAHWIEALKMQQAQTFAPSAWE